MNFEAELQERVSGIETILRQYLPAEEGYQKTVLEAMKKEEPELGLLLY